MTAPGTILHRFANATDGVEAVVLRHKSRHADGFAVSLRDTDADMVLPEIVIYPTEERAVAAARKAVGLEEES